MPPSSDLNSLTSHTAILREAGINVKGVIPETCACPLCGQSMCITLDPFTNGTGRWLWCTSCKFYGDVLELYKQMRHEKTMEDAIRRAEAFGHLTGPGGFVTKDVIDAYITNYHRHRIKLNLVWNSIRCNSADRVSDSDIVECIQLHKLWASYSAIGNKALRLFACARASEVKRLFGDKILPKSGFSTSLVFNYQDVPGRTSSYQYYYNKMRFVQHFSDPLMGRVEDGIAFLEQLNAKEDIVFAFDDPILTARLYQKRLSEVYGEFKAITYSNNTRAAWQVVNANKVILVPSVVGWNAFHHAKMIQNSYVSTCREKHNGRSLGSYLRAVDRGAQPWRAAFANWLLDESRSESEIFEAVMKLSLNAKEQTEVIESVDVKFRERLAARLGSAAVTRSTITNRRVVVEKGGAWFSQTNKGDELLCDAPFSVDQIIIDVKAKKSHWAGTIRYAGARISYMVPYEEIEKNPAHWLSHTVISTGLGSPTIQRYISGDLPIVARQFSNPKTIMIDPKLGLEEASGQVWLPRFTLDDGEFRPLPIVPDGDRPMSKIQIPNNDSPFTFADSLVSEKDPALAAYIAAAMAIVAGLLSPLGGWRRRPIGIIGSRVGPAAFLCRKLMTTFDLRKITLSSCSKRDIEYALDKVRADDWYGYLESQIPGAMGYLQAACHVPVIAVLDPTEASIISTSGQWILIHADNVTNEVATPSINAILKYIADLQRREYGIPSTDLHQSLIADFCRWWASGLNHDQMALVNSTNLQVVERQPAGVSFVGLCCKLRSSGRLSAHHVTFIDSKTGMVNVGVIDRHKRCALLFDDSANKVYASRDRLLSILERSHLPMPSLEDVEFDLVNSNALIKQNRFLEGWVIPGSYWTAAERHFLRD